MVNEFSPGNFNNQEMPVFCQGHREVGRRVYRKYGIKGLTYSGVKHKLKKHLQRAEDEKDQDFQF
jgi:hypothetical protein